MRVKIIKDYKQYRIGQVVKVTLKEGHGLLDAGIAIVTKDLTEADYKTTKVIKRARGA